MVAPTRTPQARGVKCDLCKRILSSATWLDQTKLAKEVDEAQTVLNLIKQHNGLGCPCIPKNIETLLIGSTHFEIHRLLAKQLDSQVHKRQVECYLQTRQRFISLTPKSKRQTINDCYHSELCSRFKIYSGYCDLKNIELSKQQLRQLSLAIDYWQVAMEDQTNPFNAKLAHRLGLTHHIIYACYLFKYYKILDYQLISANLLLNVFRSIEGVTANAMLHAHFLLVKSLIDCDQLQLARHYLKQATRSSNFSDKSHYESILLHSVSCELDLTEGRETEAFSQLDELAELARIKPDDKLQHYYARTLAISVLMRYIQFYPSKSEQCFEFFHAYRYVCAIIRRCYESSFELVLAEKELNNKQTKILNPQKAQILDHSWIKYAVCDFVFSTFEQLSQFYMRAGMPECLDFLFNGLNLISYRNGGLYWQSKIASIGIRLDLLCDKYEDAKEKLDVLTRLVGYSDDSHLMNVIRLESEVSLMALLNEQGSVIKKDVIDDILNRTTACKKSLSNRLITIELFDLKSCTTLRLAVNHNQIGDIILSGYLGFITLETLKIGIKSALQADSRKHAMDLINRLKEHSISNDLTALTYFARQVITETLLYLADIDKSEQNLLDAVIKSQIFLKSSDQLCDIQQHLSALSLSSQHDNCNDRPKKTTRRTMSSKPTLIRASRRRGTYEVARTTQANEIYENTVRQIHDINEILHDAAALTKEQIVVSYLRNSEPNPDYNLYRRAHELMLSFRLLEGSCDYDTLLFHFSESIPSNTMRYRWMMMEEQQLSPFDISKLETCNGDKFDGASLLRQLGFCNNLVNQEKVIRAMTRAIPDSFRLVQFKYMLDRKDDNEHLFCVSFKSDNEPVFVHLKRTIVSDDFFDRSDIEERSKQDSSFPGRFSKIIDESKSSLLNSSHRVRSDMRQKLETDLGLLLHDVENDWLGPFRFLVCGDICDLAYVKFTESFIDTLEETTMKGHACLSRAALRLAIENAPSLSRGEFCQIIATLFNCSTNSKGPRESFNKWQKSLEAYLKSHNLGSNKTAFLQDLERAQVGLILDQKLDAIPFESLPIVRINEQGFFRVPSLRLFSVISTRRCSPVKIEPSSVAYILDPANNLVKTRERFQQKLVAQANWEGTIGGPPESDELERWLSTKDLYLFMGHGAGTVYYNKLCKGRGLSHMSQIRSASIVMGCSSGRMLAEGPRLEPYGIAWVFIFRGSPSYLGLLWDVTDNDIDKYLDTLLDKWMPGIDWSTPAERNGTQSCKAITNVSARARRSCQLKLLVGSAPVVYGLPIWCKN